MAGIKTVWGRFVSGERNSFSSSCRKGIVNGEKGDGWDRRKEKGRSGRGGGGGEIRLEGRLRKTVLCDMSTLCTQISNI